MSETEFPESDGHYECYASYLGEDVDGWFKRCLKDKPNPKDREFNLYYNFTDPPVLFMHLEIKYLKAFESWYQKWFSQFNKNSEELK